LKIEPVAAFVLVAVIVSATIGAVTLKSGLPPAYTGSTTTTTETISCPTLNSTQTSGNNSQPPNYGPLLSNLSSISTVEDVHSSQGNFAVSASLQVLNRSYSSSSPVYLVNVTVKEVSSNVTMVSSSGFTTTTSTTGVSQPQVGTVLGLVASNGSIISVEKSSGVAAVMEQVTTFPLEFFEPFASVSSLGSTPSLHRLNSTVVTIGSTRMVVTNYAMPTYVLVALLEGCGSESPMVSTTSTVSNGTIQVGRVPGTDFTLVTQISETLAIQTNSTASSGIHSASFSERVTSFSVG